MRLRDEAGLATGQAGSALGRRSASWRFLGFTLAAICCRWTRGGERQQYAQSRSPASFSTRLGAVTQMRRANVGGGLNRPFNLRLGG